METAVKSEDVVYKKKAQKPIPDQDIFFSAVDRKDQQWHEEVASSYPAYMHEKAIEELKESIRAKERSLEGNRISPNEIENTRRRLAQEKTRLDMIMESAPEISPTLMNQIRTEAKRLEGLDGEISRSMFTRREMEKGLVDAHIEESRQKSPCIEVDRDLARRCVITVDKNGKTSRDEAIKMLRILNWLSTNGEADRNMERLRRDDKAGCTNMITVPDLGHIEWDMNKPKAAPKVTTMWKCDWEGCGEEMPTNKKGLHIGRHRRKKKSEGK
jgi:hypothetical protein